MTSGRPESPRVSITTLGCKVNRAETERIAAQLVASGATIRPRRDASVAVVHTCCVTAEAERKTRKAVRRAMASPGVERVVITGCMAVLDREALSALGDAVEVVGDPTRVAAVVMGFPPAPPAARVGEPFRTRAIVKAQDGCNAGCAYCIVPATRGAPRSTPLADVVTDVRELVEAGAAEVVLTGVNLGLWEEQGADLADLVRQVDAIGVERIRLSSIEPGHVTSRLLEAMASSQAVCPHLHVPLQSGSDRVLSAMGRGYGTADYFGTIERAREALPGLAVTTDVIAGFPSEDEGAHADSVTFLRSLSGIVSKVHVFRFSGRAGTRAAAMEAQVDPRDISRRAAELRTVGESMAADYRARRIGGKARVLVERAGAKEASGTSEDYLKVSVRRPGLVEGQVVDVTLERVEGPLAVGA